MRGEGWTGGKMEEKRRETEHRLRRRRKRRMEQDRIAEILEVDSRWWNRDAEDDAEEDSSNNDQEVVESLENVQYVRDSLFPRFAHPQSQLDASSRLHVHARF
jgi:hypothetical protein